MMSVPLNSAMDEVPLGSSTCSAFADETTDNDREEITAVDWYPANSSRTVYDLPPCIKRNRKKKKKKNRVIDNVQELPSSSSSCSSPARLLQKGVNCKRRRPKVLIAQSRRVDGDFENVALLLGMSFAAFVAQVPSSSPFSMGFSGWRKVCVLVVLFFVFMLLNGQHSLISILYALFLNLCSYD